MAEETPKNDQQARTTPEEPRLRLNTADLKSTYCNMVNGNSTREEVVLNFGVNQSWDRGQSEFDVTLEHRVILSPFAAKRLAQMLNKLIEEYEHRYGEMK